MSVLPQTQEQFLAVEQMLLDQALHAEGAEYRRLLTLYSTIVEARQARKEWVQCVHCGQYFFALRGRRAQYCSHDCKKATYRRRAINPTSAIVPAFTIAD
jgi:hypothetical protein